MGWHWIALVYVGYLAAISTLRPEFARARQTLFVSLGAAAAMAALLTLAPAGTLVNVIVPGLALLAAYRLSGLLFVRVDSDFEQTLREIDDDALRKSGILRWYRRVGPIVRESFELSYLLVYPALPLGAAILALAGHGDRVGQYWAVVFLAEFICYGVLPWIQTRPPMLIENDTAPSPGPIRRFNQQIAARASIRANTIPSGHAAGAFASALVILEVMPVTGVVFLALAVSIAAASVLGRYHYLIDSALGIVVAGLAWSVL